MGTCADLCVMTPLGLRFIGGAIQELQEQTLVPVDVADAPDWFVSLGFNPTWEAIGAQSLIAAAAAASLVWLNARKGEDASAR